MNDSPSMTRRQFLGSTGSLAAASAFAPGTLRAASPNAAIGVGCIGIGTRGGDLLDAAASVPGVKVVAVCDVYGPHRQKGIDRSRNPEVKTYVDYRELLANRNVDAVSIGTPDHMHAPMAMSAMAHDLHAYVQKPLAHEIFEVRRLTEMARRKRLVTQMGIQIHSDGHYRLGVETIHSGMIGKVREVHSWSNKKWGGNNEPLPERVDPVPATLNWDGWIGVAESRPFVAGYYHPGQWRKRVDFGTGTFGDMGCHILDPVFESLELTAPVTVRSEGPAPNRWNWAVNAVVHFVFPGTRRTEDKTVALTWYDGDARPPAAVLALLGGRALPDQGSLFVGTDGAMLLEHVGTPVLLPEEKFKGRPLPKAEGTSHHRQFIDAVMGHDKTTASFDYSGPLTEGVLLGCLATRFPRTTLEWDARRLRFRNSKEATGFVRRRYRKGWEVRGLG